MCISDSNKPHNIRLVRNEHSQHSDFAKQTERTIADLGLCPNELFRLIHSIDECSQVWVNMVHRYTSDNAERLWMAVSSFPLLRLVRQKKSIDEEQFKDGLIIQRLYPELDSLPLAHLYFWYSEYEATFRYTQLPTCARSPGFLFFLLGQLALKRSESFDAHSPVDAGMFVAFAFLKGASAELALHAGMICYQFQKNLCLLANNASLTETSLLTAADHRFQ